MMAKRFDRFTFQKPIITNHGYLRADAIVTSSGVFRYLDAFGKERYEFRPAEEVLNQQSLETLKSLPLTIEHPPVFLTVDNTAKYSAGYSGDVISNDAEFVLTKITVTDKKAIEDIQADKRRELSCGYECEMVEEPGEYNGQPYAARQTNIRYNHIALVEMGRHGPKVSLKLDSKDAISYPDGVTMTKVKINGIEFEVSEAAAIAVGALQQRLDAKEKEGEDKKKAHDDAGDAKDKEIEKLKGKVDALTEELKKAKESEKDSKEDSFEAIFAAEEISSDLTPVQKIDSMSTVRAEVKAIAASVLDEKFDYAGKSTMDIRQAVLAKKFPERKLDGVSTSYIKGAFDVFAGNFEPASKAAVSAAITGITPPAKREDEVSFEDFQKAKQAEVKNAWQKKLEN